MPVERFFCPETFSERIQCSLEDQEFHHLTKVIRCRIGDTVELVNGKGQLASATLDEVEKKRALLTIDKVTSSSPTRTLILAQAIPRLNRLEFILEKGTELGATAFWLFPGKWSEKAEFSENQWQRMTHLTIAAMKQCGRLDLPPIEIMPQLKEWHGIPHPIFFGDTNAAAPPITLPVPSPAILLVGPERGLSPKETEILRLLGATGVHLNHNILRTDTAAMAFLAIAASR